MTCFWDGILNNLTNDDFQINFKINKPNNKGLVIFLKEQNSKETKNIKWNGTQLRDQEIEENFIHIKDYNVKSMNGGYLCSTCDPFLILICTIFNVNINHNYCGHMIKYTVPNPIKTLNFSSDKGHFTAR
tara:strand:- start:296 stop:685 length:390 start_codon:yes stop_codon:yes gene_type:complete